MFRSFVNNLPLSKKGLCLVLIPVALQLFFLASLYMALNQSTVELQKLSRAKVVVEKAQALDWLLVRAFTSLLSYIFTGSERWESRLLSCKSDRDRVSHELEKLLENDPQSLDLVADSSNLTDVLAVVLEKGKKYVESGETLKLLPIIVKTRTLMQKGSIDIHDVEMKYRHVSVKAPQVVARARMRLFFFSGFGIFLSAFVGYGLAILFGASIATRLRVLNEHANQFATGRELTGQVSGKDEIAALDRIFRKMAGEVEAARLRERAIVENSVDLLFLLDQEFRILWLNSSCIRHLGYSPAQLIGKHFSSLLSDDDRGKFELLIQQGLSMLVKETIGCVLTTLDNRKRDYSISLSWSSDDNQYYGVAHDITEQKNLERLKQEFLLMVTQDLRRPLDDTVSLLDKLKNHHSDLLGEKGTKIVVNSEQSAKRLFQLTNELFNIEQIKGACKLDVETAEVNLAVLLERSKDSLTELAQKGGLTLELAALDVRVQVDAGKIMQVLVNLLSNAIKFSAPNTSIKLEMEIVDAWVEVRVVDQGRGVPPEMQEKIFERFQQVEESDASIKGGFGLGLPICRGIIKSHGGTIGCRSTSGQGSTFFFRLRPIS